MSDVEDIVLPDLDLGENIEIGGNTIDDFDIFGGDVTTEVTENEEDKIVNEMEEISITVEEEEDEVVDLPDIDNNEEDFDRKDKQTIEEAINKESIGTVLVKETSSIDMPCYLLDMTEVGTTVEAVLKGIECMLDEKGDTSVYIKSSSGVRRIGMGMGEVLYAELDVYIEAVFQDRCKIYIGENGKLRKMKLTDVGMIKLGL